MTGIDGSGGSIHRGSMAGSFETSIRIRPIQLLFRAQYCLIAVRFRTASTSPLGHYPRCASSSAVQRYAASDTTRENQNEEIVNHERVLAIATCCGLQRDPGGARTSGTPRPDWRTRRHRSVGRSGPIRRSGPRRRSRPRRRPGARRRPGPSRRSGASWRPRQGG